MQLRMKEEMSEQLLSIYLGNIYFAAFSYEEFLKKRWKTYSGVQGFLIQSWCCLEPKACPESLWTSSFHVVAEFQKEPEFLPSLPCIPQSLLCGSFEYDSPQKKGKIETTSYIPKECHID